MPQRFPVLREVLIRRRTWPSRNLRNNEKSMRICGWVTLLKAKSCVQRRQAKAAMAAMTLSSQASSSAIAGKSRSPSIRSRVVQSASRSRVVAQAAADRKLWAPGVVAPEYLQGELAGDYGLDPLGLGADPKALRWYRQSELVHARWAMLGVLGVLVQEIAVPDVFWYDAGRPENLPGPFKNINMGGLLAWEFILMHFVEVRRWQDYRNFGSVNE
ncbi:chlorophyll a-b binding protein, chloroplastic, partial [Haematococcus lacustris]